jgi:hypothetical protein
MKRLAFLPTPYEAVMLTILSVAILGIFTIMPVVRNVNAPVYTFFSEKIGAFITRQLAHLNTPRITTILTFLLWATVGALAYTLMWSIGSLIRSYREDISPFHGLILPQGYSAKLSVSTRITRIIVRSIATAGLVFWAIFFLAKVLPLSVNQFVTALSQIDLLSIAGIFLAIFYMTGGLFLFIVLTRLIVLKKRVFHSAD